MKPFQELSSNPTNKLFKYCKTVFLSIEWRRCKIRSPRWMNNIRDFHDALLIRERVTAWYGRITTFWRTQFCQEMTRSTTKKTRKTIIYFNLLIVNRRSLFQKVWMQNKNNKNHQINWIALVNQLAGKRRKYKMKSMIYAVQVANKLLVRINTLTRSFIT